VALGLTKLGRQERLDKVPCKEWPQSPSAQTNYVHVVVFDPLSGGEVIADQTGSNAWNLVGAD
jgi:hypothetical protein